MRSNDGSCHPAAARTALTVSTSAIENGPGPQLGASSGGGGRYLRATCFGMLAHSLSPMPRQTTITRRPPGFMARRRLPSAAAGLAKNIVPKREKQTSNVSSKRSTCASAIWKRTFPTPARAASARARLDEPLAHVDAERASGGADRARDARSSSRRSRNRRRARAPRRGPGAGPAPRRCAARSLPRRRAGSA